MKEPYKTVRKFFILLNFRKVRKSCISFVWVLDENVARCAPNDRESAGIPDSYSNVQIDFHSIYVNVCESNLTLPFPNFVLAYRRTHRAISRPQNAYAARCEKESTTMLQSFHAYLIDRWAKTPSSVSHYKLTNPKPTIISHLL